MFIYIYVNDDKQIIIKFELLTICRRKIDLLSSLANASIPLGTNILLTLYCLKINYVAH